MEQTATGLLVIGWKLAVALIAGIPILTTISVFLLARFTTVFDAYAGERAKLLAQFHNIDRLVEQTEKLTATTETIKASLTEQLWFKQQRWQKRLQFYSDATDALTSYGKSVSQLIELERDNERRLIELRETPAITSDAVRKIESDIIEKLTAAGKTKDEIRAKLKTLLNVAVIVASNQPIVELHKCLLLTRGTSIPELEALHSAITNAIYDFVFAARTDLGYEELDLSPLEPFLS